MFSRQRRHNESIVIEMCWLSNSFKFELQLKYEYFILFCTVENEDWAHVKPFFFRICSKKSEKNRIWLSSSKMHSLSGSFYLQFTFDLKLKSIRKSYFSASQWKKLLFLPKLDHSNGHIFGTVRSIAICNTIS